MLLIMNTKNKRILKLLVAAIFVIPLSLQYAQAQQIPDPILKGTIDTHVHTEEEYAILEDGSMDIIQLARRAQEKGMRAIVVKSLTFETATRAYLAQKQVPGIEVYGGLTLDLSVGGMNPAAVVAMSKFKLVNAKMVWMPVFDSKASVLASGAARKYVKVSENGKLTPESIATLDTIAKYGFSIGTAHLGADEALMIVRAARARNIPVVVTHALQKPVSMSMEQMKEAASLGAYIEHTAFGDWKGEDSHFFTSFYLNQPRIKVDEVFRCIRAVGAEHTILATDMGQAFSPGPPDGLKWFIMSLQKMGITDREINLMVRQNPARLLNLPETPVTK